LASANFRCASGKGSIGVLSMANNSFVERIRNRTSILCGLQLSLRNPLDARQIQKTCLYDRGVLAGGNRQLAMSMKSRSAVEPEEKASLMANAQCDLVVRVLDPATIK
jgi:hypothetical protein